MKNIILLLALLPGISLAAPKKKRAPSQLEISANLEKGMKKIFDCHKEFTRSLDQYVYCAKNVFSNSADRAERLRQSSAFVPLTAKRESVRQCNSVEKSFGQKDLNAEEILMCMSFTDAMGTSRVAFIRSSDGMTIQYIRAF